jgi:hypothetical protein
MLTILRHPEVTAPLNEPHARNFAGRARPRQENRSLYPLQNWRCSRPYLHAQPVVLAQTIYAEC